MDLARALAALTVAAGHVRAFVFVDFGETADLNVLWKVFYLATGLGHQAVVIFFVLSGFLVGGNVCASVEQGSWSWPEYLVKRLLRLWIVLLPALILTAYWDRIGMSLTHSPLYHGDLNYLYHSTPKYGDDRLIYSPSTFGLNLLFLQTIVAPTFGTNGPLWSLANEFWYYILFPLILVPIGVKQLPVSSRALMLLGFVCAAGLLPEDLVLSGLIWLLGVALFGFNRLLTFRCTIYRLIALVGGVLLILSLLAARSYVPTLWSDLMVGVSFAWLMAGLLRSKVTNRFIANSSHRLASFSFTLYVAHFPLAAALSCIVLRNQRFDPSIFALALFAIALTLLLLYSYAMYLLFERHTKYAQMIGVKFIERNPISVDWTR